LLAAHDKPTLEKLHAVALQKMRQWFAEHATDPA
jgi:hypothetical protein